MKIITVDNLNEGDILAKDVLLPDYTVLLGKGTKIKQEYIDKLQEYFIVTVYIETSEKKDEDEAKEQVIKQPEEPIKKEKKAVKKGYTLKRNQSDLEQLKNDIESKIEEKFNHFSARHNYHNEYGLEEIARNAKFIINDVLKNEALIDKVYDVKERSTDIYEHSLTTCTLATIVALKLKFTEENIIDIAVSSLLHDFGLRYLSAKYETLDINLLKSIYKEEYEKHSLFAYTSFKEEKWISSNAKELILGHHEKKNGKGYPFNRTDLARDCQILGICDEFDEMICGIGKAKVRVHEAICCIRNYDGIWFDSDIVEAFLGLIAVYPVGTKVRTNHEQIGIVVQQNNNFPERPLIRVLEDKYFKNMRETILLDLAKEPKIVIEEVLM